MDHYTVTFRARDDETDRPQQRVPFTVAAGFDVRERATIVIQQSVFSAIDSYWRGRADDRGRVKVAALITDEAGALVATLKIEVATVRPRG